MPSDLKRATAPAGATPSSASGAAPAVVEPPSVKLIVRLFVIPLFIVAAAVGVMMLISMLAGSGASFDEALQRFKNPGGERTADWLVGPAAKQRYLDAQTLVNEMKSGMNEQQRVALARELGDVLANHTRPDEGEVQHFVLLALGRVWQRDPSQPPMTSPEAAGSRREVVDALLRYAAAPELATRKAAVLATVYLAGYEEADRAIPTLVAKLSDANEDIDVRIAAATALGPLAEPGDARVIDALSAALRDGDPRNLELVWSSALSLAQLGQANVADTVLLLLDREELSQVKVLDREQDPRNPAFRNLSEKEIERILINTMLGARNLKVDAVQQRIRQVAQSDPSARVRAAGQEILRGASAVESAG
jgi:hypothetical protein